MNVPLLDLKAPYAELRQELDAAWHRVMASGWYVLGREVETFEAEYAAYCGAKHCVGVANALDALSLIVRAYGIGPGDEVIVPANTYAATWLADTQAGATPVPAEPIEATHNLDPARIAAAITPRTRAVLAVHLYPVPPHLQPAYAGLGLAEGRFPIAERLAREVLSTPMGPHLGRAGRDAVVAAIVETLGG